MKSKALTKVHQVSAYWSAIVHDYEHGGLNNDFLIKTGHPLAVTYNDISPLENHHLAAAVRVMIRSPDCGYLPVSLRSCHSATTNAESGCWLCVRRHRAVLCCAVLCCAVLCCAV